MKRKIFLFFSLLGIGLLILFYIRWYMLNRQEENLNEKIISDINFLSNFIDTHKNFLKEYLPKWNLILLDRDYNFIHLSNRNISLDQIKDLYVIQGNVCVFKNIPDLKNKLKDPRFNRCYTIAVKKDFSTFQIGGILKRNNKFVAYITWNTRDNMIKDYKSNFVIKNWDTNHLPYMPYKWNSIEIVIYRWNPKFGVVSKQVCKYIDWRIIIQKEGNCRVKIEGNDYVVGLIYPDWSYQLLKPVNWRNDFTIYYHYDGLNSELNIFDKVWESVYNLVKYSFNSNVSVKDNKGNTLIIRGTKFWIRATDKNLIYLDAWSIELVTKKWQKYMLDFLNNILGFDKLWKVVGDVLDKWRKDVANIVTISIIQDYQINSKGFFEKVDNTDFYKKQLNENWKWPWIEWFDSGIVDLRAWEDLIYSGFMVKKRYGLFILDWKMNQIQNLLSIIAYLKKSNKKYIDLFDDMCKAMWYRKVVSVDKFYPFIKDYKISTSWVYIYLVNIFNETNIKNKILLIKDKFTKSRFWILYYDFNKNKLVWGSWGEYNNRIKWIVLICE